MGVFDAVWKAMRTTWTPRPRRIGAREAEELLTGGPADADRRELVRLLAAASAPPSAQELAGESEVMAQFAGRGRANVVTTSSRRRPVLSTLLSKAAIVKVATGAAVVLFGGAALAAETGNLPGGVQQSAHDMFSGLGVPAPDKDHKAGKGDDAERVKPSGTPNASRGPDATGSAAFGLCQAYEAGRKGEHGKALDSTAMRALAQAAGGEDNVTAYCERIVREHQADPSHNPRPQPSVTPKSHGNGANNGGGNGNGNGGGNGGGNDHPKPSMTP